MIMAKGVPIQGQEDNHPDVINNVIETDLKLWK